MFVKKYFFLFLLLLFSLSFVTVAKAGTCTGYTIPMVIVPCATSECEFKPGDSVKVEISNQSPDKFTYNVLMSTGKEDDPWANKLPDQTIEPFQVKEHQIPISSSPQLGEHTIRVAVWHKDPDCYVGVHDSSFEVIASSGDESTPGITASTSTAKVGDSVSIKATFENIPSNASKINLYISDVDGTPYLKKSDSANPGADKQTLTYTWDTAQSNAGSHNIIARVLASDNTTVLSENTKSYTLSAATDGGDDGDGEGNGTGTGLNLGALGTISFPSTKINSPQELITAIIGWLLFILGALAVVAVIYSGLMYITAGSDPTRAEAAKKNLTWAIIGIVIVALSYVLVEWVARIISGK